MLLFLIPQKYKKATSGKCKKREAIQSWLGVINQTLDMILFSAYGRHYAGAMSLGEERHVQTSSYYSSTQRPRKLE